MDNQCPTLEDLTAWADLPADDARRAHLQSCARCQAVVTSYAAFMAPENLPAGADLQDARDRLSASLDREIGLGGVGEVVRPASSRWRSVSLPAVAATAAVMVVAVGLSLLRGGIEQPLQSDVLRGDPNVAATFSGAILAAADAGYRVSWPGADPDATYRVVIYGADLAEMARFETGFATDFNLTPPTGAAFCQVVVLHQGDEITRSEPLYFGEN